MHSTRRRMLLIAFGLADVVVMACALIAALINTAYLTAPHSVETFLSYRVELDNLLFGVCFAAGWHLICKSQGLYRSHRISNARSEWWEVTKAVALGTAALALSAIAFDFSAVTRSFLSTFFFVALPLTVSTRIVLRTVLSGARQRGRNLRNLVIVGCGPRGEAFGTRVRKNPELGYLLLGYIDIIDPPRSVLSGVPEKLLGTFDDTERVFAEEEVDEVFIALPLKSQYETIAKIIALSEETGIIARLPAEPVQLRIAQASVDHVDGDAFLTLQTARPAAIGLVAKRGIDIVCSTVALTILAPVFALVALAIKLDSSGPVFFRQDRVGIGHHKFKMLKFRSMRDGSETPTTELEEQNEVRGAAFKIREDPRLTRLGPFLRKYSIDELPQFWNVLRGEMSIVGPRPLPLRDVERFDHRWHKRRFSVKPGITCLWQVNGRHNIRFDQWMELDLEYIDNWSLALDLEIIAKTIPAAMRGTGAS